MGSIVLTEAEESHFLKVLNRLRKHQADGVKYIGNEEEAMIHDVDYSIKLIEKALTAPLIEIGSQLYVRGRTVSPNAPLDFEDGPRQIVMQPHVHESNFLGYDRRRRCLPLLY